MAKKPEKAPKMGEGSQLMVHSGKAESRPSTDGIMDFPMSAQCSFLAEFSFRQCHSKCCTVDTHCMLLLLDPLRSPTTNCVRNYVLGHLDTVLVC
jgi:hypothetical protein